MMRLCWRHLWLLVIAGAAVAACAQQPAASTPVGSVGDQIARGQAIYARDCATAQCHGVQGEGIRSGDGFSVWPLVGPAFTQRNPTAQVIFDVTRSGPEREMRALSDQEHYDAIAYELAQNGVQLTEPLTAANATTTLSGEGASAPAPDVLFPPPGNAVLSGAEGEGLRLPAAGTDRHWRLGVTQAALASQIGQRPASSGGRFLIVVFSLETLGGEAVAVTPDRLSLATTAGDLLAPQAMALDFAVARFGAQTIGPGYGTSGHAVFQLPAGAAPASLRYDTVDAPLAGGQSR
jgi:hypothetical protein